MKVPMVAKAAAENRILSNIAILSFLESIARTYEPAADDRLALAAATAANFILKDSAHVY